MEDFRRKVAIVGVAESDLGEVHDKTELQLHIQAAVRAMEDAGISKDEIDGVISLGNSRLMRTPSMQIAEYLQITPTFTDTTSIGGSSFEAHVEHAAAAIAAGLCETCLITYGSKQRTNRSRSLGGHPAEDWFPGSQFEAPFGLPMMVGAYALAATRHMHLYGTTPEQLAGIAAASSRWAAMNPVAFRREPITVQDVLASPMICSPLHKLDCCLVTDGGGAVILTTVEKAKTLKKAPIYLWGSATAHTHQHISQMPELTVTPAKITGERAFKSAGITPKDIDVVQVYDSFTITVIETIEDLGFCPKGEGGSFLSEDRISPGGDFPMNTQGGGLSYCHPGMFGIFLIIEAVRQLRGECGPRQVKDANLALCHGTGIALSSGGTLILGREPR